MRAALLLATVALWPIAAFGQQMAQDQLNAEAAMIKASQMEQVPNGECAAGPCTTQGLIPITFQVGDSTIENPFPITDANGNTWQPVSDSCGVNAPGTWWDGLEENGVLQQCGYIVGLRDAPTPATGSAQNCPGLTVLVGILPGAGSFTDAAGNTYSIDPNENTATINGQPITPNGESSNTSQMTLVGNTAYGEDATTNQWFEMVAGPGGDRPWAWLPVTALPQDGQSPTVTTRWDTPQSASSFTCQGLQAASVSPVTSLGPALSLGITTTPGPVTPANSIGGAQ